MAADRDACRRYRQRLKARSLAQIGQRCSCCGTRKNIERAHRRPTALHGEGRGSTHRYLDVLKNPGAYHALCRRFNQADR